MEEKRKKTRVRRKNSGIKKLLLILILLFIIIQLMIKVIVPGSITLSRYVYSAIRTYYLNSKEFYFNSDKLAFDTAYFESDNWSGVDKYDVDINLTTRKNLNEYTNMDVDYNIEYEYAAYKSDGTKYEDDIIEFTITDQESAVDGVISRTIYVSKKNQDTISFSVKPSANASLKNDDYVLVKIKATSTTAYESTLTGEFKIIIGTLGMSYKIEDSEYNPYCELIVTNTLDYYVVEEDIESVDAAGNTTTIASGSTITIAEYLALSEENKEKCYSMKIALTFDPDVLRLDTTSGVYSSLITEDANTDKVGYENMVKDATTYHYVNAMEFEMEAEESKVIKFYKIDASKDYTYPNTTGDAPIISVIPSYI